MSHFSNVSRRVAFRVAFLFVFAPVPVLSGRTQRNVARVGQIKKVRGRTPRIAIMLRYRPPKACYHMYSNDPFCHRSNKDGTIDSICTRCYLTVGTALNESELPEIEHSHTCDPEWLLHWKVRSRLSTHD